jgi:DNA topoisomerase-2
MNGISGIGTGFSSDIPMFNPADVVEYIKNKLSGIKPEKEFVPYYEGFIGTVSKISAQKYLIKGVYEIVNADTIVIRELPIGTWTLNYISFLEELADGGTDKSGKKIAPSIKDFTNMSTEVIVNITVVFPRGKIAELEKTVDSSGINGIEKMLKLTTTVSTTNMHLFNTKFQLHKYGTIEEIIDDFYEVRMQLYEKRKNALVKEMEMRLRELSNRAKFILGLLDGSIDLRKKKNQEVDDMLTSKKFDKIDDSYGYLRRMQTDSVTEENVAKILKEKNDTEKELEDLVNTTLKHLWLNDIAAFEKQYAVYKKEREQLQNVVPKKTVVTKKTKK